MLRLARIAMFFLVGLCLVVFAVANRTPVTLQLLPTEISGYFISLPPVTVPVFVAIFGGIVIGVLIGFVWEWTREHKHRAAAAAAKSELSRLEYENSDLRKATAAGKDDILALLEKQ